MCDDRRPSASVWLRNLRQPMPLGRKMRLLARNQWLRAVTLKGCCGHPGEPGC